ncbi:uncharacterized protein LOC106866128 [Brachypodium distachyon]|uniref:uncharacterized protein LOC106866128 n=1 Tax=Brachypodium distachyon TaxID=15368 RepID=UPI00071D0A9E|nr:uncharacterized protein LOC106866128 [Brachypodium distachyon]|eukprot:XP_014754358.1 uncharacterized protein LOC106866128 [Brachypodium distachyon]
MAAEQSQQWRRVFQREVVMALNACRSAPVHVNNASEALQSPSEVLQPRIAQGAAAFTFTRLLRAVESMTRASQYLSQALANMGAADLLARRGCGPVPAEPVANTQRLHDEWLALVRLQGAREHGQDALRVLDNCRGRLCPVDHRLHARRRRPPPWCSAPCPVPGTLPRSPDPQHRRASRTRVFEHIEHDGACFLRRRARRPHPVHCTAFLVP